MNSTPWSAGQLGGSHRDPAVLFGRMYEDVEIERRVFAGKKRVFCIASAGCTALALARDHEVVACDINPVQLAYAKRRAEGGARETGSAERAMSVARAGMPLIGWGRKPLREFLAMTDPAAQLDFWRAHLDTWRFRHGFDVLLSAPLLRLVYAQEFLAFLPPHFGAIVRARMERGFARHPNASNPYVHALLLGTTIEKPECQREVEFVEGDAAGYLESCPSASFDAFTLSNILDGAPPGYCERLRNAVRHAAAPDAVVMLRSFGEPPPGLSVPNLAAEDRALLWGVVCCYDAATGAGWNR